VTQAAEVTLPVRGGRPPDSIALCYRAPPPCLPPELTARDTVTQVRAVTLLGPVTLQHGPGLNRGISHLAARSGPRPGWIWILDSDVVARPGALCAAVSMAREQQAALVGEPQRDQWHPDGRFGMYALLMDPAVVWQQRTGPFADGGDPSPGQRAPGHG